MDTAILKHGVNLIDTAEQYPIPSDGKRANEGDSERVIGEWMKDRGLVKGEGRKKVVIASKITGGRWGPDISYSNFFLFTYSHLLMS